MGSPYVDGFRIPRDTAVRCTNAIEKVLGAECLHGDGVVERRGTQVVPRATNQRKGRQGVIVFPLNAWMPRLVDHMQEDFERETPRLGLHDTVEGIDVGGC